jgi:MoxR-like ATPase
VPLHFLGRDSDIATIDAALKKGTGGRAVITTALHGLRGVGKSTLAAAYADQHRGDYRATWWIRAETDSTMSADLAGLGVRLGWVSAEEKEEPALNAVLDKLRNEGDRVGLHPMSETR